MRKLLSGLTLAAVTLAPAAAFAHAGHGEHSEFIHGFLHPMTGLDHILAMVTVGILAYQIGGRALWLVPATFLAVMAVGGLLGVAGVSFYFVEPGIAASVVVLGAIVALALKPPVAVAMGLVALFAVFHGYAHGIEAPLGRNRTPPMARASCWRPPCCTPPASRSACWSAASARRRVSSAIASPAARWRSPGS